MKLTTRSVQFNEKLPPSHIYKLLDDQLVIILRSWGSEDFNQKFTDEVSHYLSSAGADLEVTTPFDIQENLSSLANRVRISLLLTHDLFYKSENKNEYLVGFESVVVFKQKKEFAWSSVGRFSIEKITEKKTNQICASGTDLDSECLFPVELLGLEKDVTINSGSFKLSESEKVLISSSYKSRVQLDVQNENETSFVVDDSANGSCWYMLLTDD